MTHEPPDDPIEGPDDDHASEGLGDAEDADGSEGAGDGGDAEAAGDAEVERRRTPVWRETLLLAVLAVLLAVIVKAFIAQAFYIPSASMEPGLVDHDRIVVQKVSYWGGEPQRGDVVVFADPGGWLPDDDDGGPTNVVGSVLAKVGLAASGGHLVKRVIGVAGDTVKCCDSQGRIEVNGKALDEKSYVKNDPQSPCNGPMTGDCKWSAGPVPAGHVFVMGDNRDHSADSSVHLCISGETDCVEGHEYVDDDLIVGKVLARLWPFSRIGHVSADSDVFDGVPDAE